MQQDVTMFIIPFWLVGMDKNRILYTRENISMG